MACQIINPDANTQQALENLLTAYDAALQQRIRGGALLAEGPRIQNLMASLDRYLACIGAPNAIRASTQYQILWFAD
jgi:hypothetical protein